MSTVNGLLEFVREKPRIFWIFFFSCLAAIMVAIPAVAIVIYIDNRMVRVVAFTIVAVSVTVAIVLMFAYMAWQIRDRLSGRIENDGRYKISELRSSGRNDVTDLSPPSRPPNNDAANTKNRKEQPGHP